MKNKNDENSKGRLPLSEKKIYNITARVSEKNNAELRRLARRWGVGGGTILRKLIKLVISKKISLINLLQIANKIDERGENLQIDRNKRSISARLTEKENIDFCSIATNWDFAPGTLAKLLVQYFIEIDDKDFIWITV